MISIQTNHRIQSQFFFNVMLSVEIIMWMIRVPNDINNQTGQTPSNFVKALLSVSARMANALSVGFHIIESHRVKKIQNIIRALAIDKNIATKIIVSLD